MMHTAKSGDRLGEGQGLVMLEVEPAEPVITS